MASSREGTSHPELSTLFFRFALLHLLSVNTALLNYEENDGNWLVYNNSMVRIGVTSGKITYSSLIPSNGLLDEKFCLGPLRVSVIIRLRKIVLNWLWMLYIDKFLFGPTLTNKCPSMFIPRYILSWIYIQLKHCSIWV